jgi:hypothetical protein
MQPPSRWLNHSAMTDPFALDAEIGRLPHDVASLNRITQGLLLHSDWLENYGVDPRTLGVISRKTLSVSERLGALIARDGLHLDIARAPERRQVGTCRDYALTLCSFLRTTGTPARLRCGFASYLAEGWEDHWVCEYWDNQKQAWLLSDAQLDDVIRSACGVTFDPCDLPGEVFVSAGDAWLSCRMGDSDPNEFGHGDAKGIWFIKVNVIRDSHALNNQETSEWDRWREAAASWRCVATEESTSLDRLARAPEESPGDQPPPWLADA